MDVDKGYLEYYDKVFDYLEYLGYADYVTSFNPDDVAVTLAKSIWIFYTGGVSFRMCALINFGLTMEYQVLPSSASEHKH